MEIVLLGAFEMALLSCPMCLGPPAMTLSDLSGAVSRFAAAAANAALRCPVPACDATASGLSGLAAHLAEHRREQEVEEGWRRVKLESNKEEDLFPVSNSDSERYVCSLWIVPLIAANLSPTLPADPLLRPRTIWTSCCETSPK